MISINKKGTDDLYEVFLVILWNHMFIWNFVMLPNKHDMQKWLIRTILLIITSQKM